MDEDNADGVDFLESCASCVNVVNLEKGIKLVNIAWQKCWEMKIAKVTTHCNALEICLISQHMPATA